MNTGIIESKKPIFRGRTAARLLALLAAFVLPALTWAAERAETDSALPPELSALPALQNESWLALDPAYASKLTAGTADHEGNLYVCTASKTGGSILRIGSDQQTRVLWKGKTSFSGIALDKDGRIFAISTSGTLLILSSDGASHRILTPRYLYIGPASYAPYMYRSGSYGQTLAMTALAFDAAGNLYVTDCRGTPSSRTGGVYRLSAADKYGHPVPVVYGLASPRGISLSSGGDALWISETGTDSLKRVRLDSRSQTAQDGIDAPAVYTGAGDFRLGSCALDGDGRLYLTVPSDGRTVVLNSHGIPVANILAAERGASGAEVASVVLGPDSDQAYLLVNTAQGTAEICRTSALDGSAAQD